MAKSIQSISTSFDYIDAPAQSVLDKTARSVAQRIVDETKEELDKVLKRVENIYDAYDYATQFQVLTTAKTTNIEHVQDIAELMNILKDDIKKKKYLQQVTVFIVGYEKASAQRLRLIQQVNEFLLDAEKVFDRDFERHEEDLSNPELNENNLAASMESSLDSCRVITDRLAEVNKEMVDFLVKYAQKKQGSKNQRKLEKALDQVKQECLTLTSKLAATRDDLIEKEEKLHNLYKQLEAKENEMMKYKASAESLKNLMGESENVEERLRMKDKQIEELARELKQTQTEMESIREANQKYLNDIQSNVDNLQLAEENANKQKLEMEGIQKELERHYQEMITKLENEHQQMISQLEAQHQLELEELKKELDLSKQALLASTSEEDTPSERLKQLSRGNTIVEPNIRRPSREASQLTSSSKSKRHSSRTSDLEEVKEFEDAFDLADEDSWTNVPKNHVFGRFAQYRKLSLQDRLGLMGRLEQMKNDQIQLEKQLKTQMLQKAKKWSEERRTFKSIVEKKIAERHKAQELAEKAIEKLENVTNLAENINQQHTGENIDKEKEWQKKLETLEAENRHLKETLMEMENVESDKEMIDRLISANEQSPFDSSNLRQFTSTSRTSNLSEGFDQEENANEITLMGQDAAVSALSNVHTNNMIHGENEDDLPLLEGVAIQHGGPPTNIDHIPTVADHPIVVHYIETYDLLLKFRFKVLKFLDECSGSLHSTTWLRNFQPMKFEKSKRVTPQTADMTKCVDDILNRTLILIQELIRAVNETNEKLETVDTQTTLEELQRDRTRLQIELNDMNKKYMELRAQMDESNQKYENQLNHNTSLMLEMQETIQDMRREMTDIQATVGAPPQDVTNSAQTLLRHFSASQDAEISSSPPPNPNLHFTRIQAHRNAKMLKRAYNSNRISALLFEDALRKMEEYTQVPIERLASLVQKYLSLQAMQSLAEYIRLNRPLNDRVFQLLDKVELTIEKRHSRYEKIMEFWRQERIRRAHNLLETCDTIEGGSSIFLIKPTVNQYSREMLRRAMDYLLQHQPLQLTEKIQAVTEKVEESTQSTVFTKKNGKLMLIPHAKQGERKADVQRAVDGKYKRNSLTTESVGETLTWNPEMASSRSTKLPNRLDFINTPKLLEMDMNRYLLRQTNVSSRLIPATRTNTFASPQISLPAWENEFNDMKPDSSKGVAFTTDMNLSKPISRSYLAVQRTNVSSRQGTGISYGSVTKHCTPESDITLLGSSSLQDLSQADKANMLSPHDLDGENLPKRLSMAPPLPPISATPQLLEGDGEALFLNEDEHSAAAGDSSINPLSFPSGTSIAIE